MNIDLCSEQKLAHYINSGNYKKNGFLKVEEFLSESDCRELLGLLNLNKMHRGKYFNNIYSVPCESGSYKPFFDEPVETSSTVLPGDQLINSRIYDFANSKKFKSFLEKVTGKKLYAFNKPQGFVTIALMEENDFVEWHFDQHDVVCIIALAIPDDGGELLIVPNANEKHVKSDLGFQSFLSLLSQISLDTELKAGNLVILSGNKSMHRVNKVKAGRRITLLLSYTVIKDFKGHEKQRSLRFGR